MIEPEAILISVLGVFLDVVMVLPARVTVMRSTSLIVDIEPKWIAIF